MFNLLLVIIGVVLVSSPSICAFESVFSTLFTKVHVEYIDLINNEDRYKYNFIIVIILTLLIILKKRT